MNDPDALRPTGETGESVMWKCDKCGHETPTGVEHFCDARPLPDFPAGAERDAELLEQAAKMLGAVAGDMEDGGELGTLRGKYVMALVNLRDDIREHRDRLVPARPASGLHDLGCVVRMPDAKEQRDIFNRAQASGEDYLPQIILETLRWIARSPDACASHVARPAAAGLTLTDAEREECERYALDQIDQYLASSHRLLLSPETVAIRAALAHAECLLSSRATGAEVEIVIPEPIDDEITVFAMSSETGYGNMSHWFNHRWFRAGIEYARRHATIRRGGGE